MEAALVMDTNAADIDPEHEEMRLDVEAAAAPHSIGEHADGRNDVGAAAALDDDASTTAAATCALSEETTAATKVKAKRRDDMSKW